MIFLFGRFREEDFSRPVCPTCCHHPEVAIQGGFKAWSEAFFKSYPIAQQRNRPSTSE
jgi:hypothetical protein